MAQRDGSQDLERIRRLIQRRINAIPRELGNEVLKSIRDGSQVTGSPGQPVETGELKSSWKVTRSGNIVRVFSPLFWAEFIEEGFRVRRHSASTAVGRLLASIPGSFAGPKVMFTLRSKVGGFHSVKLTRAGMQKLVDNLIVRLRGD